MPTEIILGLYSFNTFSKSLVPCISTTPSPFTDVAQFIDIRSIVAYEDINSLRYLVIVSGEVFSHESPTSKRLAVRCAKNLNSIQPLIRNIFEIIFLIFQVYELIVTIFLEFYHPSFSRALKIKVVVSCNTYNSWKGILIRKGLYPICKVSVEPFFLIVATMVPYGTDVTANQ